MLFLVIYPQTIIRVRIDLIRAVSNGVSVQFFIFSNKLLKRPKLISLWLILSCSTQATELQWAPNVIHNELSNQFSYLIYPSPNQSDPFNLRLVVNAGSVDDEMRGMAHIVEHMVFRANRAHPTDVHHLLNNIGWKAGLQVNALTRQTETQYMVRTRPNDALNVAESVALLSDLAFGAKLLDADWQIERGVILEEMRRGKGVAERVNTAKKVLVRNGSRYVDRPTIGWQQDIKAVTIEQIRDFYQRFYVPGNMTLIASGHFERQQLVAAIEHHFGAQQQPVPNRDYVKLPLTPGLVIGQVQDSQGSTSAVTLGFRNELLPKSNIEGEYQRLQNYFLRKLIRPQVQASRKLYQDNISSVHFKFSEPTKERLIAAISVKTPDHQQGLAVVLREVARLKRNGLNRAEFEALKLKAKAAVARNRITIPNRDFKTWEDKLTAAVMQEGVVQDYAVKSARTLDWIDKMSLASLNLRLVELLSASDQFLFYQLPGGVIRTLPTATEVEQLRHQVSLEQLIALTPIKRKSFKPVKLAPVKLDWPAYRLPNARVLSKHSHQVDGITQWNLANGDKVVWLNRATPSNDLYLKALSQAGYYNDGLSPWLAQTAKQVWHQADLPFAENSQLMLWQQQNDVDWQWAQTTTTLDLAAKTSSDNLLPLMKSYFAQQSQWQLQPNALTELKTALVSSVKQPSVAASVQQRLMGTVSGLTPSQADLDNLTLDKLVTAIRQLQAQPITLFIVGELKPQQIEQQVLPYLGAITRKASLNSYQSNLPSGRHIASQPMHHEYKSTVTIKAESAMIWQPEDSFLISSLNPMLQKALKNKLRHQLGGIYSLAFEVRLDKDNTLRSTTSFTTAPARVDEMINAYEQVLSEFITQLPHENFARTQQDIKFAEQLRLQDPNTWLRRLALSYQRYDGPDYLRSMLSLEQQVNQQRMSKLVTQIIPFSKQAIFVGLPQKSQGK